MDGRQMRTNIRNFSFNKCKHGNQGYNRLLVQLFGLMGHGKSCFINSCKYVVDDCEYQIYAPVGRAEDGSKTLKRDSYQLTKNITLVDNRGCGKMDKSETGEIYLQLGNFQPLGQDVIWDKGYESTLTQLVKADREDCSTDFIVPVFVHSALNGITSDEETDIKEIFTKAKDITGILPAVVITHETSEKLPEIQEKFRKMGVQHIFPLENYTHENPQKIPQKHEIILKCLCEIIKDVKSRMEVKRNPREEMNKRKKILHTFLIERVKAETERIQSEIRERERRKAQEDIQRETERRKEAEAALQREKQEELRREKAREEEESRRKRARDEEIRRMRERQEELQRERDKPCTLL